MKNMLVLWSGMAIMVVVVCILIITLWQKENTFSNDQSHLDKEVVVLRDSITQLQKTISDMQDQLPGLGEYMTAVQLHISKMWFAEKKRNWDLANYEVHELSEAMDGARALHSRKGNIDISSVLESIQNSQIDLLEERINERNASKFLSAYAQTIAACNGCHRAAGYYFISIITPASPPVTNQRWVKVPK